MKYKLSITTQAHDELKEITRWYELQQRGLGKKFMVSVKKAIYQIAKNPLAFALYFNNIRKLNTRNFPYSLYFFIENDSVIVFAISHQSRDENIWKKNVPE
jgi:toxin ParE1/3/4